VVVVVVGRISDDWKESERTPLELVVGVILAAEHDFIEYPKQNGEAVKIRSQG
jgi:hypothetical protein